MKSVAGWPAYQYRYQLADNHVGTNWAVGRGGAKTSLTPACISPTSLEYQVSYSRWGSSR